MQHEGDAPPDPSDDVTDPWPHVQRLEFLLRAATSLDQVARDVLTHLVQLPDVIRVSVAVTEGAGRRLRFVASDSVTEPELRWCHIDAYDDVPLTDVVRTGADVLGTLDQLEPRYPGLVARQREEGTCAIGAVPLPGVGSPIGGLVLYFNSDQPFDGPQRRLLHAAARRTSDAVRQVSVVAGPSLVDPPQTEAELPGRHARIELDGEPRAAGAVRRFLREQLGSWDVDDDAIEDAEVCASELVNNVIMHARSAFRLNVHLEDDVLTVTVRDVGVGPDGEEAHVPVTDDDAMRVFGRGLTLVDALADRWGSDRDTSGTIAWFVLELADDSRSSTQTG